MVQNMTLLQNSFKEYTNSTAELLKNYFPKFKSAFYKTTAVKTVNYINSKITGSEFHDEFNFANSVNLALFSVGAAGSALLSGFKATVTIPAVAVLATLAETGYIMYNDHEDIKVAGDDTGDIN